MERNGEGSEPHHHAFGRIDAQALVGGKYDRIGEIFMTLVEKAACSDTRLRAGVLDHSYLVCAYSTRSDVLSILMHEIRSSCDNVYLVVTPEYRLDLYYHSDL